MSNDNILLADYDTYTLEIGQTRKFNVSIALQAHLARIFRVMFHWFCIFPFFTSCCAFCERVMRVWCTFQIAQ